MPGTQTALVLTGYGEWNIRVLLERNPDIIAENLLEAAKEIVSRSDD